MGRGVVGRQGSSAHCRSRFTAGVDDLAVDILVRGVAELAAAQSVLSEPLQANLGEQRSDPLRRVVTEGVPVGESLPARTALATEAVNVQVT